MTASDTYENQTVYYKSSENMNEIESNSIDVIITSPPYNRKKIYSDDQGEIYNDSKPKKEYFRFLTQVWRECFRVIKPTGIFFLNIGDSAQDQGLSEEVVKSAQNTGFSRLQTIIWIKSLLGKGHYTPTGGQRRLNNIWENIFVLVKDKRQYKINPRAVGIPYADKSNIGRYSNDDLRDAGNVWLIPYSKTTGATIKKGHESPFPLELPYKCIKLSGEGTRYILDPFVGTGTTLAASKILGKIGFGYEKYPRKDLIQRKIIFSSMEFSELSLIPHLEKAVSLLSQWCNVISLNQLEKEGSIRFTKKEKEEIGILNDVLKKLDLEIPLMGEYFNHSMNKGKKTSLLSKYF